MSSLIKLENITKTFHRGVEEVHALDGVDLEISEGDYMAICGHSGSGKSTLLNIAGCMDHPTTGQVILQGTHVEKGGDNQLAQFRRSMVGFVFQQFFLIPTLTVMENVRLPLLYSHKKINEDKTVEILKSVGLGHRLKHLPGQLSGGEMQRVAVARSLINDPKVILADEPTGNLDSKNSISVIDLFEKVNSDGIAVVMVTHNNDIAARCRKQVHLEDGKITS